MRFPMVFTSYCTEDLGMRKGGSRTMLRPSIRSSISILMLEAFGVFLTVSVTGCTLQGADFDTDLILRGDGVVYKIGEQKPYTGKAYQPVCDSCQCGFFNCFVHWRGQFRDGRRDGTFEFPRSRRSEDFFCPGDKDVAHVKFIKGVEQRETDVDSQ